MIQSVLPVEFEPFWEVLVEGGFVVEDPVDELCIIRERFSCDRESGPLHLVIAPTLNCNLACTYCYQSHSPEIMTRDVCDHIAELLRRKLKKSDLIGIDVDWYGGEPLLAQHIISYLSRRFLEIAEEFKCEYEASIATNGTLLDDLTFKMLISNKVTACQITIDGPREVHDKRRRYKHGNGSTFDRILENIKRVIGKIELSVRINVDTENMGQAFSLLDIFREEGFFRDNTYGFFPYLAMTGPLNLCVPYSCNPVNMVEFYKKNLEFQKRVFEYSGKKYLKPILDFPFPVGVVCGALSKNSYAFDPEGYYYKCGLEIGEKEKQCGCLDDYVNNQQYQKWETYDPLMDKECMRCHYLPFCMGGCPKMKFDKNSFYAKEGCVYWKKNLRAIIKSYVRAMEEVNDRSNGSE